VARIPWRPQHGGDGDPRHREALRAAVGAVVECDPSPLGDLTFHGIRDLADRVFCSADIGLAKPDPRVYEFVAESASLVPERTLYLDDTESWVEAGRRLGMRGHVYDTPAVLRRHLAELGVEL